MSEQDNDRDQGIDEEELRDRVAYALFSPAMRLALRKRIPLSWLKKTAETAYFHEARKREMTLKEITQVMGISISKAALLSKQLKQGLMQPDVEYALPRQIEYMLWAGPLTMGRINQNLTTTPRPEIEAAVEGLIAEQRIERVGEGSDATYRLDIRAERRVWDNWLARLDGLNRALRSVGDAVLIRFFGPEGPEAFARTLSFHIRREDLPALQKFYNEQLFPFIAALNEAAEDDRDDVTVVNLSVFWAEDLEKGPPEEEPT